MTTQSLTRTAPNQLAKENGVIPKSIKSLLASDYFKTQVSLCLPKHLTPDRFMRVALTAITRTPKLADCTPESVIKCMMTCSELGIEPDGRRAHLIPFGKDCTLIIDYKGLVELAKRSGDVSNIHAQVVCENDTFEYDTGEVTHKIDFRRDRGAMYAVYAVIKFKDGAKHTEVMTKADVDRIRKRSKASGSGPWVTDYDEMAKKTVFRRASKWIVLSPEVQEALDKEDDRIIPANALVAEIPFSVPEERAIEEAPAAEQQIEENQVGELTKLDKAIQQLSDQEQLAIIINELGFTFEQFCKWAGNEGHLVNPTSYPEWSTLPTDVCKRMLRAKAGLKTGLEKMRGAV